MTNPVWIRCFWPCPFPGKELSSNTRAGCALEYYLKNGFTCIELGDAEELWENDNFDQIYITHTPVYELLAKFHDPDPEKTCYIKAWGNHDPYWAVFENLSLSELHLKTIRFKRLEVDPLEAKRDPRYYNTGSCVHPLCITGLEISFDDEIQCRLIKWHCDADRNMMAVKRVVL